MRWIVGALIATFFAVILVFASDVPISDDFVVLDFVNRFVAARDPSTALQLVVAQHNEHRILTCKLMFLASLGVFGFVSFRAICVVSALYYVGVFRLFLASRGPRAVTEPRVLLFVACMVFQFSSAESMLWAMTASSNPLVILCAMATFHFGERDGVRALVAVIGFSLLALLTQGNGLVVPFLAVTQLAMRRRFVECSVLALVACLAVFVYFRGFHVPTHHADPAEAVHHLGTIGLFSLTMLGCAFSIGSSHHATLTHVSMVPACLLGAGVLTITAMAFVRARGRSPGALSFVLVFLVASTVLSGIGRHTFGFSHAMVSRYHMYSTCALVAAVLLAIELVPSDVFARMREGWFSKALPWLSLAYVPLTFVLVIYFHFIQFNPSRWEGRVIYGDPDYAHAVLETARNRGVLPARRGRATF